MILEVFFNLIKFVLINLVNVLPDFAFNPPPEGMYSWVLNTIQGVAYFLPINDFLIMFGLFIGIHTFWIMWRLIQRLWDALPFT